jgi:DNA polymerase-3 subunit delta
MAYSPESVLADIKQNKFAPIYFLQGEEPYYIDQITEAIEKNALQESEKGFNQVVMYGKDTDVSKIITNARRYPMMAERQVVIVKEAQEIVDLNREEGQRLLESYIKNPLPSTILVFAHKHKTLDGRKSLSKAFSTGAVMITTKKIYDNKVPEWVTNYVKNKGYTIDAKATQMLADFIGNNLSRLSNEIDKIIINLEKTTIDAGIVQQFVGISKEYNTFELQKALAIRDIVKANRIVNYFEANPKSNPVIMIIGILYAYYAKLLQVHHAKDKSEKGLASLLQLHPFVVKEYVIGARNYPVQKVIDNIHHLRIADLYSKGINANLEQGQILRELIFKLLH